MGNPTDPPEPWVIDKLCEAARDDAEPPLQRRHRRATTCAARSPPRYESRFGVDLDPDTRSRRRRSARRRGSATCAWPCSGRATRPSCRRRASRSTSTPSPWPSANVIALDCPRPGQLPRQHRRRLREPLPEARRSWSSTTRTTRRRTVVERAFFEEVVELAKKYRFFVIHDFAYGDICFDGYQAPSFLSVPGRQGGRLRVHDDVQGLQHGRLAGRLLRRQPPRCSAP